MKMMILINKTKIILRLALILGALSCQSPLLRHVSDDISEAILTGNQSFTRSGYQKFDISDSLQLSQTESIGGLPYFSFLQYSGKLIYTTHNGRLYFTSLNDIEDTRRTQVGVGIGAAPTLNNTTLFIPILKGKTGLVAYDIIKGSVIWEIQGKFSQSSPVIYKKLVIHASTDGSVAGYDIGTQLRKWEINFNDRILNNLALVDNKLIVVTQNGTIRSYNPGNGSLNWSIHVKDAYYASPVINSSSLFIAGYSGSITKIDLNSGNTLNTFRTHVPIYYTPACDGNFLYIPQADGQLLKLDTGHLQKQWIQQLEGPFTTAPLVSNSEIYLGTASRKMYRLNKTNGSVKQTFELDGRPRSQPIYHQGTIYISYEPDYLATLSAGAKSEN